MIITTLLRNGKPCVVVGITREDCERLIAGDDCVATEGKEVGSPIDILVFANETNDDCVRALETLTGAPLPAIIHKEME